MLLCVGTSKGIVILDPDRGGLPLMALADPSSIWCMAQDSSDRDLLYAGSISNSQAGSARGRGSLARSSDGGRSWQDITPGNIRDEEIWSIATPAGSPGEVFIGTSHARIMRSLDGGHQFRECAAFLKIPGRERWGFPPPPHIPHVRSIAFDHSNPLLIYVGVEEGGVYRSPDRGRSFEPLDRGVYSDIHCVAADPSDPQSLFVTTGRGFYFSNNAGASWKYVKGFSRSYMVPLLIAGETIVVAAAAGPPSMWPMAPGGADALLFRSVDRGRSFIPMVWDDGVAHPMRGMVMRLLGNPANANEFFGVLSDGSAIRVDQRSGIIRTIANRLPPAYDFAVIP
ncbi:MAG TPA: hypothetical protein VGG60_00600 [Candidatus Binataceae bacterium]|jgi:hypothetical protein